MTVRRFFLTPLWLLLSLPGILGWRLLPALATGPLAMGAGIALLIAAVLLIPLCIRVRQVRHQRLADALAWAGFTAMGFFSTLFVLTLLREVLLLCARFIAPAQWQTLSGPSARAVVVLAALFTVAGLVFARLPRLVRVDIPIAGLPADLHGFSIAQLSDVHVGPTIKRGFVQRLVARVNALGADLIAVTGDLVDGSVEQLALHTAPLAGLEARHGAFFVTGNHEYYSGEAAWTTEIRRLGLTVLKNQHVVLSHGGAQLVLAGVTDVSAHYFDESQLSDPRAALEGAPPHAIRILLAHQPSSAAAASNAGFHLQLSGHTHGGQFWPWNLAIPFFQPFSSGLNRLKDMLVYVSRGSGYWGPPNRFGVPAEITQLRLVPAPTS
jgi:predicted MPP superfamily phosphohydrolase